MQPDICNRQLILHKIFFFLTANAHSDKNYDYFLAKDNSFCIPSHQTLCFDLANMEVAHTMHLAYVVL